MNILFMSVESQGMEQFRHYSAHDVKAQAGALQPT